MVTPVNLNTGLSEQDANGLPSATAIATLELDGYNELPSAQSRSLLAITWDSIQDPIFLLLVGSGVIC
jgi:P-type Ca2+ transporter type 2C